MTSANEFVDKELYTHQFLAAIFHINLSEPMNCSHTDDKAEIVCFKVNEASDDLLNFSNFRNYVFETLVDDTASLHTTTEYIDPNFFPQPANLFNEKSYRVFEDESNTIGYLFNCYYRCEHVKDFNNILPMEEVKSLKKYIVNQVSLQLLCPAVNARYQNDEQLVFQDFYKVLTYNIPWPIEFPTKVKKFFLDIIEAMEEAKGRGDDEDDDSALAGLSKDEISIEKVAQQLYAYFCNTFKDKHLLSPYFIDHIKYISILYASPKLAEIFIDLNSPSCLKGGTQSPPASSPVNNLLSTIWSSANSGNSNNFHLEKSFHGSLLGILLACSPLTSPFSKKHRQNAEIFNLFFTPNDFEYPFFQNTAVKMNNQIEAEEMSVDDQLSRLRSATTEVFYSLLKNSPVVRNKTLRWIECCLATFNSRSTLWANELMSLVGVHGTNTSDGMILNLSAVLLSLCKPFCAPPDNLQTEPRVNSKMLKVDLAYMRYAEAYAKVDSDNGYGKFLDILNRESSLISSNKKRHAPASRDSASSTAAASTSTAETSQAIDVPTGLETYQPNFITRCFYLTHKALHLGFRVLHERFTAITQENGQLQRRLESQGIRDWSSVRSASLTQAQRDTVNRLNTNMTITLSIKSALTENNFLNLLFDFYVATAAWINNLAVCETEDMAAKGFKPIMNGAHDHTLSSPNLRYIPEFIVENIIDFMLFLRYFEVKPKIFLIKSHPEPLLTMVVLFMGNSNRMRNPHLRAKIAEMLEALLPTVQLNLKNVNLEELFCKPYFVEELFPSLLNVFVSIEISDEMNNGDVVAFEQKFNYRRPMYVVFKYLCTILEHQQKLMHLADYAEKNIDSDDSPIFLRFINLLINDAIFLLDEGLSLMAKLREKQQERDSGAWQNEAPTQRHQHEANFIHLGRLAKFHNYIGRDTIRALCTITDYVKSLFSHKILADRMASMLNYFLHNLVGPNKTNFKVEKMDDYEFNPGELVRNICQIYVNLACPSPMSVQSVTSSLLINPKYEQFCLAIARDDRSYSPDLLKQAVDVLGRLKILPLVGDLLLVDRTVKDVMRRNRHQDIPLDDIPEEFLDPLMSTLMSDPVILPGSRKVLDRGTIIRHLLSDNTDPYTRTPLTMNMLIPDVELKGKIEAFIKQKLSEIYKDQAQSMSEESSTTTAEACNKASQDQDS